MITALCGWVGDNTVKNKLDRSAVFTSPPDPSPTRGGEMIRKDVDAMGLVNNNRCLF